MSGFTFQRSLQILALDAIIRPDWEASYRRVCRWYSKNFHVSLPEVQELPVVNVMREYYEGMYEDLSEEDLAKVAAEICETEADKAKRIVDEARRLQSEATSVMASLERVRKSMEKAKSGVVQAVDTLGKQRRRPDPQTVSDLVTTDDMDGLANGVNEILKNAAPAPKPRAPDDFFAVAPPADFKYTIGGTIDDDMDAVGGNLMKKKP